AAKDARRELAALLELEARGASSDEDRAALDRLRPPATAPRFTATFDVPLDPRCHLARPPAVHRRRPRSVLAVEGGGAGVLARLPVVWDGGWLEVTVEADVDRTEWGSGVSIGLAPRGEDAQVAGVRFSAGGGGEIVRRHLDCRAPSVDLLAR